MWSKRYPTKSGPWIPVKNLQRTIPNKGYIMDTCIEKIRTICADLLAKGEVQKVIGFAEGSIPMASRPIAVTAKADVEKLVFNSFCGLNLANYVADGLPKEGKIAVLAKGCDSRNLVTHMVENQV